MKGRVIKQKPLRQDKEPWNKRKQPYPKPKEKEDAKTRTE